MNPWAEPYERNFICHADDGAAFSLTISQAFSKWINMFCQVIAMWVEKNGE